MPTAYGRLHFALEPFRGARLPLEASPAGRLPAGFPCASDLLLLRASSVLCARSMISANVLSQREMYSPSARDKRGMSIPSLLPNFCHPNIVADLLRDSQPIHGL